MEKFYIPKNLSEVLISNVLPDFFDSIGLNYSIINKEGNYIIQNKSAEKQISKGLKNAELIDKQTWEDCKRVMDLGILETKEEPFKDKFYLSIKQPIVDNKNTTFGILIVSLDVTDKKKSENSIGKLKNSREFAHGFNLTERESECIYHMVRGMSAKQIGRIMALSNRTVETYLNNAKLKLSCKNKQELILKAFENGMF